jgi:hypothetical protein
MVPLHIIVGRHAGSYHTQCPLAAYLLKTRKEAVRLAHAS